MELLVKEILNDVYIWTVVKPRRRWEDKWIFRKLEWVVGTEQSRLRIRTGGGHL
jgi:hypothetical protein